MGNNNKAKKMLKKRGEEQATNRMTMQQIALKLLSEATEPKSIVELWHEAVRQGLDKICTSTSERMQNHLAVTIYRWAKLGKNGVVEQGSWPILYSIKK